MSQCGNKNELALQHGGFCTTWSLAAKGLFLPVPMIGASIVIRVSCTVITHRISGKHHGVMIFFRVCGEHWISRSLERTRRLRAKDTRHASLQPQLFFVISVVVEPLCFHFSSSGSISILRYLPLKLYTYLTLQTQVLPFNKLTPGGPH